MRIVTASTIACVAAFSVLQAAAPSRPALAQGAAAYCSGGGGKADARKTPSDLVAAVAKTFGIDADMARAASYVRCAGHQLLACSVGANLDCGKADVRRSLSGAAAFCRSNPGSADIPMVATGHATIYDWHCVGHRAVAGKIVSPVDRHGFIAANWKAVE
ncbi:MAG TPA: hypothetical protein VG271_13580 [Beijerinckiaceae bacterium]|nr:hypothetical protein [Beijerinckiaceae bacterium]